MMIDGYPDYMMESIKLVEEKREKNITATIKPMNMEERDKILREHHPDYMENTKRTLKIGVDKGQLIYNGIVDLLEANSAQPKRC